MIGILALVERAHTLGASLELSGGKETVRAASKLPAQLLEELRARRDEVVAALQAQPKGAMRDIPFPAGYAGLPPEAVALGERIVGSLKQTDPVLRRYNVLATVSFWLLNHRQNRDPGRFDDPQVDALYRALQTERARLAGC